MLVFRSTLLVALISVAACDEAPDDVDRTAEDLDLEDEDDALDAEMIDGLAVATPDAPTRTASTVDDSSAELPLAADNDPQAMKREWECDGDPEGGTYNCCIPWGPYDVPYCCWWNGGGYDCG